MNYSLKFLASGMVVAGALSLAFFNPEIARAADHIDSPRVQGTVESASDITDIYAFRSPNDSTRLVLMMNMFTPVGAPDNPQLFDPNTEYVLFIDTNGDLAADRTIKFTFDSASAGAQTYTAEGIPNAGTVTGSVTARGEALNIQRNADTLVFAGLRDDPFFFDFVAFGNFLSAPCVPVAGLRCPGTGEPSNFFRGLNVSAIVIELPTTSLPGIASPNSGSVGVWAKTFRN